MNSNFQDADATSADVRTHRSGLITLLLVTFLLGPSLTAGAGTTLGPHVLVSLLVALWFAVANPTGLAGRDGLRVFVLALCLLALHAVVAEAVGGCQDLLTKSLGTALVLALLLGALASSAVALPQRDPLRVCAYLLGFVLLTVVVERVYLTSSGASSMIRPSGVFLEPSHLALACSPLLIALMLGGQRNYRLLAIAMTGGFLYLAASATLFLLIALALPVCALLMGEGQIRVLRVLGLTFAMALFGVLAWQSPFWPDFVDRLGSLGDQSVGANVSSVVYVMGWELADANLTSSAGWGLGLNRMGCFPRPFTPGVEVLDLLGLEDGNYNDGSFLVSKLLSELGFWGPLALLLLGFQFVRMARRVRAAGKAPVGLQSFLVAAFVCGVFGAFLRGTGYFAGPVMLAALSFFWMQALSRPMPLNAKKPSETVDGERS
ncbi:MAG: hypothetical protein ACK5O3_14620 [Burkholderiales bacterium]